MIYIEEVHNIINEAYYGKEYVKSIEDAMKNIHAVVIKDKNYQLNNSNENSKLEKAIKDTFGFKEVGITWTYTYNGNGPYTITSNPIITTILNNKSIHTPGKPYYDQNHILCVYIVLDASLIYTAHLTPAELTSILLHEIGHNFDFSINRFFGQISNILNMLIKKKINKLISYTIVQGVVTLVPSSRDAIIKIREIDTTISDIFPPLRKSLVFVQNIYTLLDTLKRTIKIPKTIFNNLRYFSFLPLLYYINYFLRSGEIYADSFAASYGYGSEIGVALDKMMKYYIGYGKYENKNLPTDPILHIITDIILFNNELFGFLFSGHGTQQQRAYRVLLKLKDDLRNNKCSPAIKKELEQQIKQAEDNYNEIINMDSEGRKTLTVLFRKILDQWYSNTEKISLSTYIGSYSD